MRIAVGLTLIAGMITSSASAVDGVLEINQACATSTNGCFPGDSAGFPVTITTAGSYRLTSNLTVPDANTDGIDVSADNVTIDLNGFSILGPCTGGPPCSPTGTGIGINRVSGAQNTAVKNGTVKGMGHHGIAVSARLVENVSAWSNGGTGIGIYATVPCTVTNSTASGNNIHGISQGGGGGGACTVSNSSANSNGANGIALDPIGTVTGSNAGSNSGNGILATTVTGSTAMGNAGNGISATTVTNCTMSGNGTNISASGIAGHNICGPNGGPFTPCP